MRIEPITPLVTKRLSALQALTSVVLAFGTVATSNAQTNATAPAPVPTQVVILGTIHGSHKTSTN